MKMRMGWVPLAAALASCATAEAPKQTELSFAIGLGEAAPQASLYANCIAEAAAALTYDREGDLIRYHCKGPAAQAFFDALGAYAARWTHLALH